MGIKRRLLMFIGIFIPFFAIFLMSQNTSALTGLCTGTIYHAYSLYDASPPNNLIQSSHGTLNFTQCPVSLLAYNANQIRDLNGITVVGTIPNPDNKRVIADMVFMFDQVGERSFNFTNYVPTLYLYSGSTIVNVQALSSFELKDLNQYKYLYLKYDTYDGEPVDGFQLIWNGGTIAQSSTYIAEVGTPVTQRGTISYDGFAYNLYASSSDSSSQIADKIDNLNDTISDHYTEEHQAYDNISNQKSSDISNAENQQTTNLIGVLSSFLTQLSGFSATNCQLSLPFPQFIGGTQTVDICQGKDVLGNFITIIGTLAMVAFYIPLAIVLLRMIFNEIRSFTNG